MSHKPPTKDRQLKRLEKLYEMLSDPEFLADQHPEIQLEIVSRCLHIIEIENQLLGLGHLSSDGRGNGHSQD